MSKLFSSVLQFSLCTQEISGALLANYGHVHTAAEYGCQSLIRLHSHTVQLFTGVKPHSVTELTTVHFQDSLPHSRNTRIVNGIALDN